MKRGLVLEGGAMRGMYTAGVIDVLMENGVETDGAVGVSAGAAFGCNLKSKQIGRVIRYNTRFCNDPRYVGIGSLIKTGNLYNEQFCYHDVPSKYDIFDTDTFEKNPYEFYVVATDVNTGEPVYHKLTDGGSKDLEWIRASASMPLVSTVVKIDGYELLDGGVADSIPFEWFTSIGYTKNIVVLTRPRGYRKKKSKAFPITKFMLRKYPKLAKALENRHNEYNASLDKLLELEKKKEVYVICPSEDLHIKRVEKNPEKLRKMYELGRKDCLEKLEEIRSFLQGE